MTLFARLTRASGWSQIGGPLFRKYIAWFLAVVCLVLLTNGLLEIGFAYREHEDSLIRIQREQVEAAAFKIGEFIKEIQSQIGWTTQLPWAGYTIDERRLDGLRLLRQVPAITDLVQLDPSGKEQLRVSRLAMDVVGNGTDFSLDPKFTEAVAKQAYYGGVYFRRESEPYMTLAVSGISRDTGVSVAEVNLKLIWDVVSQIKVGERGHAYVVDAEGRLIAHPDLSLVLGGTDMTQLSQVAAARAEATSDATPRVRIAKDIHGHEVLTSYASVTPLGWLVFVELPTDEAYAPIYQGLRRSGALLIVGAALAFLCGLFLARRIIVPIRAMRAGAARIGAGDLTQRIAIKTGDELEGLADEFNRMTAQLQDSYANLEGKVDERTQQLALANLAKSRFLAAASHDLRQPLQALGLSVAQLRGKLKSAERNRLMDRIDTAVAAMNELFDALLDISKLDVGGITVNVTEFPIALLMSRIEFTFAEVARDKGLSFRLVSSGTWVRSDFVLLERILLNLVSNAVRYTPAGAVMIGCRRRGETAHIQVRDSGPGIPEEQQQNVFVEFYRLAGGDADGGLGLGLSIVDRLCRLLGHPIEMTSTVGKGSRFSVVVPLASRQGDFAGTTEAPPAPLDMDRRVLVAVIDDDVLVQESLGGLLRQWGCRVVPAASPEAILASLADEDRPDLIICDYCLTGGNSGIKAIEELRASFQAAVPAFLISGDTAPERLREAQDSGHLLLHKPVSPMKLRAMLSELLRTRIGVGVA
jgi:signal transduction histidine kinase/CheY-like chemotaxis protein